MPVSRVFVLFLIFNFSFFISFSQDIHFSQFYMSPLNQNPAMAGANYDLQAILNYKDQWRSVAAPYKTMAVSFDMRLPNKKKTARGFLAAGINIFNDQSGDSKMGTTQGNLNLAYHLRLGEYSTIGAGLMGGFVQRSISYSALEWGNQYDGTKYNATLGTGETQGSSSFTLMDAGAGLVWTYNNTAGAIKVDDNHDFKANLGVAVFHPHQPAYSYGTLSNEKLYAKIVVHGNAVISIPGRNLGFIPGFMYYKQGPAQEIYAGSLIRYKLQQNSKYTGIKKGAAISLGAFYRAHDALVATFLLEYSSYALGVSYDLNTSKLKTASTGRGGIEISIRFVTPNPFGNGKSSRI
ncbi:MAG: PorP/SprF family type IX secretion system membrane protein [Bacteroidota bacterium]